MGKNGMFVMRISLGHGMSFETNRSSGQETLEHFNYFLILL
jgi:hypothetical protein